MTTATGTPRAATSATHNREAATHFARMAERLGRAVTALQAGRWDSARDHLFHVRHESAICDTYLNSGQPDPATFLSQVRAQVPQEWVKAAHEALKTEQPS